MQEWEISVKHPPGPLCVQGCCCWLPWRGSCSSSVTTQECSFSYILRAVLATGAFVSQHSFADWPVGRGKGRNTSSMAVLPLGKEGSSVWWHRPRGHSAMGSPCSPRLYGEKSQGCGCPHAHKWNERGCFLSPRTVRLCPGKQYYPILATAPLGHSQAWFDSQESPEADLCWQLVYSHPVLSTGTVTSMDSGCSLPVGISAWECCQALLSLPLQTWPSGIPDKGPATWGATASS